MALPEVSPNPLQFPTDQPQPTDQMQPPDRGDTRPPNPGDLTIAQTMNPPAGSSGQSADAGAPSPASPPGPLDNRTLVPSTSQTFTQLKPATDDPHDTALVDAANRFLQTGHKFEELPLAQRQDILRATTGSSDPPDDVVNADPALFKELRFKPGKYKPQLLDELGDRYGGFFGPMHLTEDFLKSAYGAVVGVGKGMWDTAVQDAQRGAPVVPVGPFGIPLSEEGLAQRAAWATKSIVSAGTDLAKIPFGLSYAAMDGIIRLERPFANAAQREELDNKQSEILRHQALLDSMAQNTVDNSQTMAGNVLKSVGLSNFGDQVAKAPVTDQQAMIGSMIANPLTYAEFGGGAVAKAEQAGTRFQALEEATAAAKAAGQQAADIATKKAAIQAVLDHPASTAENIADANSAMAAIGPAEAQAAKTVAATTSAQQLAKSAVDNDILAGQAYTSKANQVLGTLAQAGGKGAEAVGKIADWTANLGDRLADKYLSWLPEYYRKELVDHVWGAVAGGHVGGPIGGIAGGIFGPALGRVLRKFTPAMLQSGGRALAMVGEQYALGEQTLPFFQNLAEKSQGVTKAAFSFLNKPLVYAMPDTLRAIGKGSVIGGAQGYLSSGGQADPTIAGASQGAFMGGLGSRGTAEALATGGRMLNRAAGGTGFGAGGPGAVRGFIGAVGSGLGQLSQFNSPAELHIAGIGDRARFIKTLSGDNLNNFLSVKDPQVQLGIATHALAHPDMQVSIFNDPSNTAYNGHHQVIDTPQGPRSAVSINASGSNPLVPILTHEIGHHIAANGYSGEVYNRMLGDVVNGTPGLFAKRGPDGKPMTQFNSNGIEEYVPNETFENYKTNYNSKLPPGQPPEGNAGIAQELFSDLHASAMDDPQMVQKFVRGFVPDNLLGQNVMDHFFSKVGVPIDASTGRPAVTDTVAQTQGLNHMIIEYYRQRQSRLQKADDETGLSRVRVSDVRKGTPEFDRLSTTLNATGDLKRNPDGTIWTDMAGRPQVLPEKTVDAIHGALTDHMIKILSAMPGEAAGEPNPIQLTKDRQGHVAYVGPYAPDAALDALAKSNLYNASQMLQLKQLNGGMMREDGTIYTTVYNTAGKKGKYATLPARSRAIVPVVHEISPINHQWNIGAYDPEQLETNMAQSFKNPKVKALWDSKIDSMHDDVGTYLGNLVAGRPGETGIGIPKKGVISQFFGFNSDANPTIGQIMLKNPSVFKSFRVDRMNQVRELPGQAQPFRAGTYEQIYGFMQPRGMGAESAPVVRSPAVTSPHGTAVLPAVARALDQANPPSDSDKKKTLGTIAPDSPILAKHPWLKDVPLDQVIQRFVGS